MQIARFLKEVKIGRVTRLVVPLLAASMVIPVLPGIALSQLVKLPIGSENKSQKSDLQAKVLDVSAQREKITRELAEAEAALTSGPAAPAGISAAEIAERRHLLDSLVTKLQLLLSAISDLEEAQKSRKALEEKAAGWSGFPEKPPYSILKYDELNDATANARLRITGIESSRQILQQVAQRQQEGLKKLEAQQRQSDEAVARETSISGREVAAWRRDLADLRRQSAITAAAWAVKRAEVSDERLSMAKVELSLLERQKLVMRPLVRFNKTELELINERIKADRSRLDQEMEATISRDAESARKLMRAEKDLSSFHVGVSGKGGASEAGTDREILEARVRLARAWMESSRFETELLAALININQGLSNLWEIRYEAFNSDDSEKIAGAQSTFKDKRKLLQPWLDYARRQLEVARSRETEQRELLSNMGAKGPIAEVENEILDALDQRKGLSERLYLTFGSLDRKLQQWLEEIETQQKSRSVSRRVKDMYSSLSAFARKVWQFELLAVEDTMEIGGQKITTTRGVTVGKSIGALLLFFVCYLGASYASRRMERVLVSRFAVGEQQAKMLRRWMLAIAGFILLLITLNLARIPLSVFAFLGGALAIGVGFGTQTLIKNLISGILILLERQVQVGDIVDVDGVVGRVTAVDIRASTVLGFDGMETVIPNSTFLEQKVTNWTHSDKQQRRKLSVGVSYGSDVDLIRKLLAESATSHGLVLAEPPPMVLFEDFGDNALIFAIYYWIDLGTGVNSLMIASDLRFMIERRFADSGVVVAFPQRDVNLRSERPLKVEVVS